MVISVASGKGGTGKTTIAVNLALTLEDAQLIDCDVEEPNAHIFIKPEIKEKRKAYVPTPEVDNAKCNYCGRCREVCAYNAIVVLPPSEKNKNGRVLIFSHLCHNCGACSLFCPQGAIKEVDREIGTIEVGAKGNLQFVSGQLNIGETMSSPLIRQVKEYINSKSIVIIDAPPGTSCPVITAVKGSDFCVLVTEPTPFGLNDLTLAVEMLKKLEIPFGIVINRSDIGSNIIDKYCEEQGIPILMRIPFRKEIAFAYSEGIPIIERFPEYKKIFYDLFKKIKDEIVRRQDAEALQAKRVRSWSES